MTAFFWRLVSVLGSALVLQFMSEFYFVNEGPVRANLSAFETGHLPLEDIFVFIPIYGLFAYIFLIVIAQFSVTTLAGLYLAGCIFGWAAEALVVAAAHESPPVSWFWTSASWHPLLDVFIGWYLVRLAMRRLPWPLLTLVFAAVGIIWAFWATWFWNDPEPGALQALSAAEFRNFALVSGTGWIIGMVLADFGASHRFEPGKLEIGIVGLIGTGLFVALGFPYLPWSLGVLVLLMVTFWALGNGARNQTGSGSILAPLSIRPPAYTYAVAIVMPLTAIVAYGFITDAGLAIPTETVVPLLLVAGVAGYFWSLWRAFRSA